MEWSFWLGGRALPRAFPSSFLLLILPSPSPPEHPLLPSYTREDAAPDSLPASDLAFGLKLSGYVKAVGPKGLFLALDRDHDARIRIGNLSDG